jgi:hypothetical protein
VRFHPLYLCVPFLAFGCGGAKVGAVSGKVILDGKPLANARVNFQPLSDAAYPGIGSFGQTDANGEYTLSLIDGSSSGAIVGKHRVAISCFGDDREAALQDDRRRTPPDKVPARYNVRSDLAFEVRPGDNQADFDLKSR